MVVFVVTEMDRTPGELTPAIEDSLMDMVAKHPFSAEGGDECWMNIDDPELEIVWNDNLRQESSQNDQINLVFPTKPEDFVAVGLCPRKRFAIQQDGIDAQLPCAVNPSTFTTGDDKGDDSVQLSLLNLLLEIDQSSSSARNQNSQSRW